MGTSAKFGKTLIQGLVMQSSMEKNYEMNKNLSIKKLGSQDDHSSPSNKRQFEVSRGMIERKNSVIIECEE